MDKVQIRNGFNKGHLSYDIAIKLVMKLGMTWAEAKVWMSDLSSCK